MRIKERHGSPIRLEWQDGNDVYIRGHVTAEAAIREIDEDQEIAELRHIWARWYPTSEGREHGMDDEAWMWHTRETPAPGWARVTQIVLEVKK
jgi:hypothetical protein